MFSPKAHAPTVTGWLPVSEHSTLELGTPISSVKAAMVVRNRERAPFYRSGTLIPDQPLTSGRFFPFESATTVPSGLKPRV